MQPPSGWEIIDGRLMFERQFDTFASAKEFVDRISSIAEKENHHPDLHFGWGYVVIELFTHDVGAITEADYSLAQLISHLE